jgi:uncharacterized membrane protein
MNPFDPKSALLAKHAQHVVLIHFPIALFLAGAGFDMAARWTKRAPNKAALTAAARLNILAAAVFVLPTLVTGIIAWQWQFAGKKLKGLLLLHLGLGCTAGLLICVVASILFRQRKASALPAYYLPLEMLTAAVVGLAAHVGGFLSGVNVAG